MMIRSAKHTAYAMLAHNPKDCATRLHHNQGKTNAAVTLRPYAMLYNNDVNMTDILISATPIASPTAMDRLAGPPH